MMLIMGIIFITGRSVMKNQRIEKVHILERRQSFTDSTITSIIMATLTRKAASAGEWVRGTT
ncbi:hypothetical protein BPIT_04910 [Candidatus Brocadia pituitae]|nr:hypothetical protein BPIT_04910 [Candidatus Brocadia pituitae]